MPETTQLLLAACMLLGAVLYTSVGHAGASAYIALMALFGVAPAVMRPTALALNILVASFTSFRYLRAGLFRWRTLWPFAPGAVPFAFLGGAIQLPGAYYRPLVGAVLLLSGARLLWSGELGSKPEPPEPPHPARIPRGVTVSFFPALLSATGGIILPPLLLFFGCSADTPTAAVAAVFILRISVAGLLGNVAIVKALPADLWLYAVAVTLGAIVGTTLGIPWRPPIILKAIGFVLIVAGLKLVGVY